MGKGLTIDNLGTEASVEWAKIQEHVDLRYITEVPVVSKKAEQAIIDIATPSHLDELFDLRKNPSWALFHPFKGYHHRLKKLFQRKLIPHLDPEKSRELLDTFFEEGEMDEEEEAEKLYTIFQEIENLDAILEEIVLNLLSCLKP